MPAEEEERVSHRYPTPDVAAADYFRLRDHVSVVRAQRLSETVAVCSTPGCVGRLSPAVVRVHEHEDTLLGPMRAYEWRDTCSDCGEPWRPLEIEVGLVRDRGAVRPDASESALLAQLSRLLPLRRLLEPRPRDLTLAEWWWSLSLWRAYLHPCVGTYAATARLAQEATGAPEWTTARVQGRIDAARATVAARMGRRERRAA